MLNIAQTAYSQGKRTVLCTVPEEKIRRKLLRYVSIAVFNEFQMGKATKVTIDGLPSVKTATLRLYGRGVETIIVKMNNGGTLIFADENFQLLEAHQNKATALGGAITPELKMIMEMINSHTKP